MVVAATDWALAVPDIPVTRAVTRVVVRAAAARAGPGWTDRRGAERDIWGSPSCLEAYRLHRDPLMRDDFATPPAGLGAHFTGLLRARKPVIASSILVRVDADSMWWVSFSSMTNSTGLPAWRMASAISWLCSRGTVVSWRP